MLTAEQVRSFHENGFVEGFPVYDARQVDEMGSALAAVLAGESEGSPEYTVGLAAKGPGDRMAVTQTVNAFCADPVFHRHIYNPHITTACAALLGVDSLRVFHDQILIKPPGGGKVIPWHQDYMYWQIIAEPRMMTCWMPLDDATTENGCMMFVPRSHKWGLFDFIDLGGNMEKLFDDPKMPPGETIEIVPLPTKAGHCTFHHSLTFHGTSINTTDRPRRAVIVHYMAGDSRYNAAKDHVVSKYISCADGEVISSEMLPLVFHKGEPVSPDEGNDRE